MTSKEIREIAINSAEIYYKYLDDNDKGLQIINVFDIKYIPNGAKLKLQLKLSAKIVDKESIFIWLRTTCKKYTVVEFEEEWLDEEFDDEFEQVEEKEVRVKIDSVLFVSYNEETHTLIIEVPEKLVMDFTGLKNNDIQVNSDLKFLVARVRNWYAKNGAKIAIPTQYSVLKEKINEIEYLEGVEPSENQKQSIYNIFNNPFTYIWGAPGTGKTQFVLAYAVLHYIRNGYRMGVLAPTNNALEQVLRGIILMTDKAGISREVIVRVGRPSQNFAKEFPEVCPSLKKKNNDIEDEDNTENNVNVQLLGYTLDGYASAFKDSKMNVQHIFLDEAGYANMIKAGMLFNHKVPITLLGDHAQLPPVCELNDFSMEKEKEFENMFLWAQSSIYFETLFYLSKEEVRYQYLKNITPNLVRMSKTSLNTTYRFAENLAKVLGFHVYSSDFSSGSKENITKIRYIHASKENGYKSRESINEAFAIKQLTKKLKMNGITDFAILTPYKKQVKLLGELLPNERHELKIMTVHGSQGREWDTVIISVTDTSDKWFVDSLNPASRGLNLVNTAVSRARKELIIVCDSNYWKYQTNQLLSDLIRIGEEIILKH